MIVSKVEGFSMALGKRLVIYFFFAKDGIADRYLDCFFEWIKTCYR